MPQTANNSTAGETVLQQSSVKKYKFINNIKKVGKIKACNDFVEAWRW
jgi:hypothetical protein